MLVVGKSAALKAKNLKTRLLYPVSQRYYILFGYGRHYNLLLRRHPLYGINIVSDFSGLFKVKIIRRLHHLSL